MDEQRWGVQDIPNPSEFMRARHPDLFSDARVEESLRLPRAVFEYHLETLTSRKQEYEFEHFCRKLAEKEICPNLRVQTGPTGGGDSKVDTETYPVAAEIAERWWIGEPSAGTERWAFAFSAKQAWKPKIEADVDKILSTGRDYKRIYFFTSQFVSDKQRSALEDALSRHASVPVHIIDRGWIVAKVYDNNRLELAVSTLGIEGVGGERQHRPGPRDTARLAELEELDKQVADPTRYHGARYQLVEDCLRSVILARGLERPRNEVESRFAQAARLAKELDYRPQRMRIAYNQAWTAYWWYEDYNTFGRLYDEVEEYLERSMQAAEVERLLNLWQLLLPSVAARRISAQNAKIEPRRDRLVAMLRPIADDLARLNNALQARTGLALIKLAQSCRNGTADQRDVVWADLSQIVDESAALGTYPVERLSNLVHEFGQHFDSPAFDALYEKVVDAVRRRRSEGEAGVAYSERAVQKLQHDKPYEAIRWFGRAEELLLKEEYRAEFVMALVGSSYAYERVGLIWAARNKVLVAVERCLAVFSESGQIIGPALLTLQRLCWIELQLGRIPHVLDAMTLARFAASHLKLSQERQAAYSEQVQTQEAVLGIHLLNIPFNALPAVSRLPDVLERLCLKNARLALLFALGQEKPIYDERYFPVDQNREAIQAFFEQWHDQPAAKDIPPSPVLVDGPSSLLRSTILGTEIVVDVRNDPTSFAIAESVLGAIEALLATSDENDLLPHRESTTIAISPSDHLVGLPQIRFLEDCGGRVEIVHAVDLTFAMAQDVQGFRDWLGDSVVGLLCRIFVIRTPKVWMDKIAGQERAFCRALMLGDVLTLDRNVFGDNPKLRLTDWLEPEDKVYDRLRSQPWRVAKAAEAAAAAGPRKSPKLGSGSPPADLLDWRGLKHTERRILSPIDTELWDRAKWRAVAFGQPDGAPPFLGIVFDNREAAQAIFRAWRERWGQEDKDDALRVAIITGVSARNPAHYAVAIGPNLNQLRDSGAKAFTTVSRLMRMEPTSSVNLDRFLAAYRQFGGCVLIPAQIGLPPTLLPHLYLAKRKLKIRPAWQIGEHDPDAMVLQDDDDPVVPPMVRDPPVSKALEQMREFRRRHGPNSSRQ
jgi:hypothetical protein